MKDCIAVAREIATKPKIVLMDEPFGALDAQTRSEMQQMLLSLWEEEKNTIVFVTHDITEAVLMADRIVIFSPSPARIVLDREVPFAGPRPIEMTTDAVFIHYCQVVLQTLKSAEMCEELRQPTQASATSTSNIDAATHAVSSDTVA